MPREIFFETLKARKAGSPTFLIDLPIMILFGALFALFQDKDNNGSVLRSPYLWHGLVFTSIFNAAVVYAIIHYPDWMWMYFLEDSHNTTTELLYLFLFLYYFPYLFGFYLGRDLRKKSPLACLALIIAMAAVEGWLISHLFDRYAVIGTREQFLAGTAVSLFGPDNPIGVVMNGSVAAMVVYWGIIFWRYKKCKS